MLSANDAPGVTQPENGWMIERSEDDADALNVVIRDVQLLDHLGARGNGWSV